VRCTDTLPPDEGRAARRTLLLAGAAALVAGCASKAPAPAPAPAPVRAAPPGAPAPAAPAATPVAPAGGTVSLPPPGPARNWDEFRRQAGRRLVQAHPSGTYMGKPPDILLGIPVIETELYVDGTIKSIRVLREPSDPAARDVTQLAVSAIRRAAPYGDMSRMQQPWKWVETFLFNDKRQFKPRSLD